MTIAIVRTGPDGWARVRALRLGALAEAPDAFGSTLAGELDQPETFWRDRLGRATTLIAALDGADAGMVVVGGDGAEPGVAGVYGLWVAPIARGRSVGDALMEAAVAEARQRGFMRMVLDVAVANARARALYARHGFAPSGRSGHLPPPRQHIVEIELARTLP